MKHLLILSVIILLGFASADETKLYGVISYLSADQQELRIEDLSVFLNEAKIEGFLSLGALVEIEGNWRNGEFIAEEVEVKHSVEANLAIYRGQVIDGKLLGLEFENLPEGQWLELTTQIKDGSPYLLLIRPLATIQSAIQATVEALTVNGFVAGGVQVVSSHEVALGDQVSVTGNWLANQLVSE